MKIVGKVVERLQEMAKKLDEIEKKARENILSDEISGLLQEVERIVDEIRSSTSLAELGEKELEETSKVLSDIEEKITRIVLLCSDIAEKSKNELEKINNILVFLRSFGGRKEVFKGKIFEDKT